MNEDSFERVDELCDRFESIWQAGQRPRVGEFLRGVAEPERSELLRELLRVLVHYLRSDQRQRWQQDERASVREYLHETPELREEPELVFGLICDEVLLRQEWNDTSARPEDYLDLLPSHEAQLRDFFADRRARHRATRNVSSARAKLRPGPALQTVAGSDQTGPVQPDQEPPTGDPLCEPVGPQLPRYEITGELGRGAMGVVYKARQVDLKRFVALKMILSRELAAPRR